MLQYAPLEEVIPPPVRTEDGHRRRKRRDDTEHTVDTAASVMPHHEMPVQAKQPPPAAVHSVLDALHPDLMRIVPYAMLLFFVVVIMMMVDMKNTLHQLKDIMARERLLQSRPFLRSGAM